MRRPERTRTCTGARTALLVERDGVTARVSFQFHHTGVAAAGRAAAAAEQQRRQSSGSSNRKMEVGAGAGAIADAVFFCCSS